MINIDKKADPFQIISDATHLPVRVVNAAIFSENTAHKIAADFVHIAERSNRNRKLGLIFAPIAAGAAFYITQNAPHVVTPFIAASFAAGGSLIFCSVERVARPLREAIDALSRENGKAARHGHTMMELDGNVHWRYHI